MKVGTTLVPRWYQQGTNYHEVVEGQRVGAEDMQELPPKPRVREERRDRQVKIRLSGREVKILEKRRPDLKAAGIVSLLIDDVLEGRHNPSWMLPPGDTDPQ